MPLPTWMIAIRDPAHAYMLLSSGVTRPRTQFPWHRKNGSFGYLALTSGSPGRVSQPTAEETQQLRAQMDQRRAQSAETDRLFWARLNDVEQRFGELLEATAAELTRVGAATLRTTTGDIHARIICFPNDHLVVELVHPRGWSQGMSSQARVAHDCVHALASTLAQAPPDTEPLAR